MEWKGWIGKRVYIKLKEFYTFTNSEVIDYVDPFLMITDRDGLPVTINTSQIEIIKEDVKLKDVKDG